MLENDISKNLLDRQFRNKLRDNPMAAINKLNDESKTDAEFKVVTNTKDTVYVVLPGEHLQQDLSSVAAGVSSSTAASMTSIGSLGSASTVSSVYSCLGSASTAGSVGSVSTASSAACN